MTFFHEHVVHVRRRPRYSRDTYLNANLSDWIDYERITAKLLKRNSKPLTCE